MSEELEKNPEIKKMSNLSTLGILEALSKIGNELREMSSRDYWTFNQEANAQRYFKPLMETRRAYAAIRDNADAEQILTELAKVLPNAQQVSCELILKAMNGTLEGTYFTVKNHRLVTIYE